MKVCKELRCVEAMALGESEGHPSHIYYQLCINTKYNVVFRKLKSHLKILIYVRNLSPFLKCPFHLNRLEQQWDSLESVSLFGNAQFIRLWF